ncbi:MAG: hypothetical protein ACRD8W_01495 [Nitrososphaeraceae archaeon]
MIKPFALYKDGRITQVKLLILGALACCLAIDTSFGMLMDVFYLQNIDLVFSNLGFVIYTVLYIVYAIGLSVLLNLVRKGEHTPPSPISFLKNLKIANIFAGYLIFALVSFVVLQMVLTQGYSTFLLVAIASLGYGIAAVNFLALSTILSRWFIVDKNKIILIFAVVAAVMLFNAVNSFIFFDSVLILNTESRITNDAVPEYRLFLSFDQNQIIALTQSISVAVYVSLTWIGVVLILKHNIRKIGKALFFLIVIPPLAAVINFHISSFSFLYPDNPAILMITPEAHVQFILYIISFLVCAALFGLGYFSISKHIENPRLKGYIIITGFGFLLFYISGFATILNHSFPPYGLISLSLVGLSSYLLLIGIYYSAASIAQDTKLRMSLRKALLKDTEFLQSIGNAEVVQSYQKRVVDIVKKNKDSIVQESGIEPSVTMEDMKSYLEDVMKEIIVRRNETKP